MILSHWFQHMFARRTVPQIPAPRARPAASFGAVSRTDVNKALRDFRSECRAARVVWILGADTRILKQYVRTHRTVRGHRLQPIQIRAYEFELSERGEGPTPEGMLR